MFYLFIQFALAVIVCVAMMAEAHPHSKIVTGCPQQSNMWV